MYIVDVQGFQYKNVLSFMCKEISILNIENASCEHRLIKMPVNYESFSKDIQQQIDWSTTNIHGLQWSTPYDDDLAYEDLPSFIKTRFVDGASVFVKGLEKKRWLEQYLPNNNILDLDLYNCPRIKDLVSSSFTGVHCNKHYNNELRCTKHIVYSICRWHVQNIYLRPGFLHPLGMW